MCGPAVRALQTDSFDNAVVSGQTWPDDDEVEVGAPSATSSTTTVSFSSAKNNQGRQEEELCGTQLWWIHC